MFLFKVYVEAVCTPEGKKGISVHGFFTVKSARNAGSPCSGVGRVGDRTCVGPDEGKDDDQQCFRPRSFPLVGAANTACILN